VNINATADEILKYLSTKHIRVYRNKAPQCPIFPYVIFKVESATNTTPSEDLYLNIDIYEDINKSVRAMEDLADLIDNGLNQKVINTEVLNLYFDRETRQYVTPEELVSTHLINLRYVVRAYFK
jgi:hypothetical protein